MALCSSGDEFGKTVRLFLVNQYKLQKVNVQGSVERSEYPPSPQFPGKPFTFQILHTES